MYTHEELCRMLKIKRVIPPGHIGPTREMVRYAEKRDKNMSKTFDSLALLTKELEERKNIPYFPELNLGKN